MQDTHTPTAACGTADADAAPRLDLYAPIHKALRHAMTDTLGRVGRLGTDDPAERCTARSWPASRRRK